MSSTLKNLLVVLGVVTIAYGGYYLYTARSVANPASNTTDIEFQAMLTRTQVFITRSQELDEMQLDFSLFEDPIFNSLRSNREPLQAVESGRSNPFAETSAGN